METLTPQKISSLASSKVGYTAKRREVLRLFRKQDESHLFPIRGKFNATERAIRHLIKSESESRILKDIYEICLFLDEDSKRTTT